MFPLLDDPGACPICSQERLRALHVYPNRKRRISRSPNLALMGCEACGMMFSHPLPSERELEDYYRGGSGWEDKFERVSEEEDARKRREKLQRCQDEHRVLREHLAPPAGDGQQPRVLDFGCGRGEWMDVLADDGWETCGMEPGESLAEEAGRRHRMVTEIPGGESFDLVILNRVLEHLRDPLATLRELAAVTAPGGQLYVTVPDLARLADHRKLAYVTSGIHVFSFTDPGLTSLLALGGFEVSVRFGGAEWDQISTTTRKGLSFLATRSESAARPGGEPLQEAVEALREYARAVEAEEAVGAT